VLADHLKLLALLWSRPTAAMGAILDRGSALFALAVALGASFALRTAAGLPFGFFMPVAILALVYVPGVILIAALIGRLGSIGMVLQRDYSPLLTCAAMIWTAAALAFSIGALALPADAIVWLGAGACLYFAALMALAVRTLFGMSTAGAIGVAALSWIPLAALVFLWGPLQYVLGWLASPFFLFYAWYFLGGELRGLGGGLRTRQSFRRSLEAAAVNPHDGDAQYQLGLIHQQRRQYSEAVRRFRNAVAIDPEETDAHFQLGRIAREQGRYDEALSEFEIVVRQDEKHSSSEIRRELGAAYLAGKRFEDARRELEIYAERRPYDPEGLYYYGQAMEALGDAAAARDLYERAVEAARTAPRYRRRITAPWSRLAQKEARRLSRS
jgi:tetratricopeptide (TPR) repeat protein